MIDDDGKPPLALIAGPTASGKSAVAVALAQRIERNGQRAVVINADSAQVYADLRVLSARPSEAEMMGIEHRLFGIWDGGQPCSAADWAVRARAEIAALHAEDAVPVLVGGTGLYLRTLLDGIAPVPQIDADIRATVRALSTEEAHAALAIEDPEAAARLAPADTSRIMRALEVLRSTGRPLAHWQRERTGGIGAAISLKATILLPEREELLERIDRRFAVMLEQGAADEVQALTARNLDAALPVSRAIGVREIAAWQAGKITREEAVHRATLSTRQYAKRQYTWFRNQPPASWHRINFDFNAEALAEILFQEMGLT